jgi:hypothetical protein
MQNFLRRSLLFLKGFARAKGVCENRLRRSSATA